MTPREVGGATPVERDLDVPMAREPSQAKEPGGASVRGDPSGGQAGGQHGLLVRRPDLRHPVHALVHHQQPSGVDPAVDLPAGQPTAQELETGRQPKLAQGEAGDDKIGWVHVSSQPSGCDNTIPGRFGGRHAP
jgi:hypothetical protein